MKLIIDIPEEEYLIIKTKIITGDDGYLDRAVADGIQIPDNATNGDVLKMVFPNIENQMIDLVMRCGTSVKRIGNDTWMNLPYQKGGK